MAKEEPVTAATDPAALAEESVADQLLHDETGGVTKKQFSIAQMLAEEANLERLTILKRREHLNYAKAHYLFQLIDAIPNDFDADYDIPDFDTELVKYDLSYRKSQAGYVMGALVKITHIFEKSSEGRRGFFGRAKP